MYNNTRVLTEYHKMPCKSIVKYIQFCYQNTHFIGHLGYKMHNIHIFMNKCINLFPFPFFLCNGLFVSPSRFYTLYSLKMTIYSFFLHNLSFHFLKTCIPHKQRLPLTSTENLKKKIKKTSKKVLTFKTTCAIIILVLARTTVSQVIIRADVAELADALDSGSSGSNTVGVRVPSSARTKPSIKCSVFCFLYHIQQ